MYNRFGVTTSDSGDVVESKARSARGTPIQPPLLCLLLACTTMPKRGAEHQLTSDSRSDDEDEACTFALLGRPNLTLLQIIETGTGFRKADEKTLASRPYVGCTV